MTAEEMRLRCVELAIPQAQREGHGANRNKIAEIATWFYNFTINGEEDKGVKPSPKTPGKTKADKVPPIFE
jgi:hypothetical protein